MERSLYVAIDTASSTADAVCGGYRAVHNPEQLNSQSLSDARKTVLQQADHIQYADKLRMCLSLRRDHGTVSESKV